MTTTYYVSYEVKKSNGAKAWYVTKDFNTEDEARAEYIAKTKRSNINEANLFERRTYEKGEVNSSSNRPMSFDLLSTYSSYYGYRRP